jgi:hypothetical protein
VPGRGKGPATVKRTRTRDLTVGWTQSARATKYIEFHGGVRLSYVYLPARSLHTPRALQRLVAASMCMFITAGPKTKLFAWGGVRFTGRKLRELVQIQIL